MMVTGIYWELSLAALLLGRKKVFNTRDHAWIQTNVAWHAEHFVVGCINILIKSRHVTTSFCQKGATPTPAGVVARAWSVFALQVDGMQFIFYPMGYRDSTEVR